MFFIIFRVIVYSASEFLSSEKNDEIDKKIGIYAAYRVFLEGRCVKAPEAVSRNTAAFPIPVLKHFVPKNNNLCAFA